MAFSLAEAIVYFKGNADKLVDDLGKAQKETKSAADNMGKFLSTAIVSGAAIAATAIIGIGTKAFSVASDIDAATDQIGASLGLGADEAKAYGEAIKAVYGDNFGDSIEDVGKSVEVVAKQLKLAGNDPSLKKITENAYRLQDVFGTDVADSISAVKTLMDNFGISAEEAFDMLTKGYQVGLDRSGDFLDTVNEYSTQFANGGASAREFFSIIETGAQGGALGTDKAADAFKEFRVRIQDGSQLTKDSLALIGIDADEMAAKFADGSITAMDAFNQVTGALNRLEDDNTRMIAGVGLLGTQFEDLGQSGVTNIDSMSDSFASVAGATDALDSKYTSLGSVVEGMWRKFEVGIAPAGEALLTLANDNLPAIQGVVDTVTQAIVDGVNLIPVAIAEVRKKWDDDWAGIRSTWESFAAEMPEKQAEFWREWNKAFGQGSQENEDAWEKFFAGLFGRLDRWGITTLDFLILMFKNWNNTTAAWHALSLGDWSTFWSSLGANFTNAFDVLLGFLDIFNLGFKEKMVGGFQDAFDGLKDLWKELIEFWSGTFGWLLGIDAPNPDLAIVNPANLPGAQPKIDAINAQDPLRGGIGQSNSYSKAVNVQPGSIIVNGSGNPEQTAKAVEDALIRLIESEGY